MQTIGTSLALDEIHHLLAIPCLDKPETTATEEVHSDRSTSGEEQSQAESKEEEVESEEGEKEVAAVQERKEEVKKEEEVKKKEGSVTGKQGKKAAGKSTPSPKEGAKKRHGNKAEQKSGVQEDESNAGETEPAEEPGWCTVTGRKPKVSVVTSSSMANESVQSVYNSVLDLFVSGCCNYIDVV